MVYFNKHITHSALISCIFFAKTAIIIAEPRFNELENDAVIIPFDINSNKTKLATSIKITPIHANNKFIDELSKESLAHKKAEQKNTKALSHKISFADRITVMQKNELQFIDGYKINFDGKHSTYFYGYINEYKNGKLYGYLYDKKGQPIYFYGSSANNDKKSIYVHDQQSGIYILNNQKTKDNTTK